MSPREQGNAVMERRKAWTIFACLVAAVLACRVFGYVPLFGALAFVVLPSSTLVMLATGVGAVASLVRPMRLKTWYAVVVTALVLLTLAGAHLRRQSDAAGHANVHHQATVTRPVVARLREPFRLDGDAEISYDRALFDAMRPWCRESCIVMERLDWHRRPLHESRSRVLEDIGLKPDSTGEPRIRVTFTTAERGNRKQVVASVSDGGQVTARWTASLPALDRKPVARLPAWLSFALEENPVLKLVMPSRRYLERDLIRSFLTSAVVLERPVAAPVFALDATTVSSEALVPVLVVDRQDPRYLRWWYMESDRRCDGVVSVEQREGIGEAYLSFPASGSTAPKVRITAMQPVICAGDAVYVQRYGRMPPHTMKLSRYDLTGEHTADLSIRLPAGSVTKGIVAHEQSEMTEREGRLRFVVRNVRFEWAKDANKQPVRKPSGEPLEHAIIDRQGVYEVTLPQEAVQRR